MPELRPAAPSTRDSVFHLQPASVRTVLRVKSWAAERTGAAPLALAGSRLPDGVGPVIEGPPRVLCTGPGEWLMVHPPSIDFTRLRNVWAPELTAQNLALVNLTDGLVVFEVSGSAVRDVLSKSCGLNFHPRRFGPGHCARTRFAQIPVVIDCTQDSGVFELYAPRSYAQYLTHWLSDASAEFAQNV
jgi:heterotetrameric sarcosine oxidase gamma subunit